MNNRHGDQRERGAERDGGVVRLARDRVDSCVDGEPERVRKPLHPFRCVPDRAESMNHVVGSPERNLSVVGDPSRAKELARHNAEGDRNDESESTVTAVRGDRHRMLWSGPDSMRNRRGHVFWADCGRRAETGSIGSL